MMKCKYIFFSILVCAFTDLRAQGDIAYLKANALRVDNPEKLSDSIYRQLTPYSIIMFGEMHGTNESAPFVQGLSDMLVNKGDSVQVGFEIPPELMNKFSSLHTDSSIYQSTFFQNPPFLDGKESLPWANLISHLNKNKSVQIFFFDVNTNEGKAYERDSLMAAKIKTQFNQRPQWKMITLGGNYHNRVTDPASMVSVLKRNLPVPVCSLNMEYKEGTANANFTHGLEIKQLGSYPSVYNSTDGYGRYLILLSAKSNYDYNGFYYTKYITAAKLTSEKK